MLRSSSQFVGLWDLNDSTPFAADKVNLGITICNAKSH